MQLRSLAIGLTLGTAGTIIIGVSTQQFASAEISSGDRPALVPIEPCRLVDDAGDVDVILDERGYYADHEDDPHS